MSLDCEINVDALDELIEASKKFIESDGFMFYNQLEKERLHRAVETANELRFGLATRQIILVKS